jgi:hypothetical protein
MLPHEHSEHMNHDIPTYRPRLLTRGATVAVCAGHNEEGLMYEQKEYTFDAVMTEDRSADEVFACTGAHAVKEAARGVSAVVFAFGQAGSGKTYTLLGERMRDHTQSDVHSMHAVGSSDQAPDHTGMHRGVASMTYAMLRDALQRRAEKEGNVTYAILCSAVQVYCGHVHDLLAPDPCKALHLRARVVAKSLSEIGGEVCGYKLCTCAKALYA